MTVVLWLLISSLGYSQVSVIQSIPIELEIVLSPFKNSQLATTHSKELSNNIKIIETGLQRLDTEVISLLIKGETYKTILEFVSEVSTPPQDLKEAESLIGDRLRKNEKLYSPTSMWLIYSIQADLVLLNKNQNKSQKETRKREILAKWCKVILTYSPLQFNDYIKTLSLKVLMNISAGIEILISLNKSEVIPSTIESKFISIKTDSVPIDKKLSPSKDIKESLNETQTKLKKSAQKLVEKINVESPPTIDKKEGWIPKQDLNNKKETTQNRPTWRPKEENDVESGSEKGSETETGADTGNKAGRVFILKEE